MLNRIGDIIIDMVNNIRDRQMLTRHEQHTLDIHTLYAKLADATNHHDHIMLAHEQWIYFLQMPANESLDESKRIAHNNNISNKA